MPVVLDAGDRKLLIGAGVLLVLLLLASSMISSSQKQAGIAAYPSSYSTNWDGAKAAYLLLQELGFSVKRWDQSPLELKNVESHSTWVIAEPLEQPSAEEKVAIRAFLQNGGRVLAIGSGAASLLPEGSSFSEGFPLQEQTKFKPLLPSPLIRDAPEISMIAPEHWQPKSKSQLVVYGNDDTAAVVTYTVGRGQVTWWGAPTPLTNSGLRQPGNLALFLNSIGETSGAPILWDEYFHGAHGSLWDFIARTPIPWGIAQFGIVFLAILATYTRRQGPISTPAAPSRLSPLEFVETLGDLYSSAHAGSAAVRIASQRLRFQLTRKLALPVNVADTELANAAATAFAWNQEQISDTLIRSAEAGKSEGLSDRDTLELVQKILDYSEKLELTHRRTEERPSA
jgi:Domain of unknown function (DUF4350)